MFNHEPDGYECPLCVVAQGGETDLNKKSDIVFENERVVAYVSPKWWEHNPGNVLVIPRAHIENVYDMPDELLSEVYLIGKRVALGIKETYASDGISFRQHNEPARDCVLLPTITLLDKTGGRRRSRCVAFSPPCVPSMER